MLRRSWNEGVISHIVTALQLDETTDHKFHFIPGYKIGQEHEIDIVFIMDGRFGIAECKRRGKSLRVEEVEDYLKKGGIAAKIGSELIVFSCLDTFPQEIKEEIGNLSTQIPQNVEIIELKILESNSE